MNYFDADTYKTLYSILEEMELAETFAGFFDQRGEYYVVKDEAAYTSWLSETLFEGGTPDDDWIAWSGTIQGKSTEGSGTN